MLFDALFSDTLLEDLAALDAIKMAPATPRVKGQAVHQAPPATLPRIERRHDEVKETLCAYGQAFKRIGEEVSEQLDCVPAQFFVLRHIRGKYACACCQTSPGCADARADDRQGPCHGPQRSPCVALRAWPK